MEDSCYKIIELDLRHIVAVEGGLAKGVSADDRLDMLADRLSNLLLSRTNDRTSDLYTFYFKDKRPSELKLPVLGKQLSFQKDWVEPLQKSPDAELSKLGAAKRVSYPFATWKPSAWL